MKNKNNITKIMLLTCLIVGGSVNAENFFTCVPEEDWFKKNFELNMLEEKFKVAKTQIDNGNAWKLVAENKTSGSLGVGVYRTILAAASGGDGGDACTGCSEDRYDSFRLKYISGNGGKGQISDEVFMVSTQKNYNACIGLKGKNGEGEQIGGSGGGGGGGSAFSLSDGSFKMNVAGGGGGGGGSYSGGGGGGGAGGYGCAKGGMGGFGDRYPTRGEGGKVNYSVNLFGISGKPGNEDSGSSGGAGGSGYVNCANGGSGASGYGKGYNGSSCGSHYGDGYVKIYKYIG